MSCARPTVDNAVVTPGDKEVAYQASFTVTCSTGYWMSGDDTVRCGGDGNVPTCKQGIELGEHSWIDRSIKYIISSDMLLVRLGNSLVLNF